MVTYLIGTDGRSASETICDNLAAGGIGPDDHLVVINVQTGDDVDDIQAGKDALEVFEERFEGGPEVEVHQLHRGKTPSRELVDYAEEVGADRMVIALRRHSRTERVIFGSVAHSLLQTVPIPITLVPLDEGVEEAA